MTTYELLTGTREEYETVQAQLISDFIQKFTGAEVTADWRNPRTGRIVSFIISGNSLASVVMSVYYPDTDETKRYLVTAISCGYLLFVDKSLVTLYDEFVEADNNLRYQWSVAVQEAQRREKEALKLEKKRKANEKKLASMKASAEKEFENLLARSKATEVDEFYWTLGWLAAHIGTLTAKMPDFLEPAFIKHFGEVEHTTVDSTKVGPSGFTSQWRLSMEASLVKAKAVPVTLTAFLSQSGKKISKTDFVWKLVDDYGFQFGKKQDIAEIMRHVPIEYIYIFNEGMKA